MTFRVIYDLATGARQEIPLTPEEVTELEAVVPAYQPPVPQLCCVATLDYSDFDVSGVANGAGMSFAFMVDTGKMWIFFEEPMSNVSYPWNVSSSIGKANVTDRQSEYIEITVTDDAGALVAEASISVQIFKVS